MRTLKSLPRQDEQKGSVKWHVHTHTHIHTQHPTAVDTQQEVNHI